MRRILFALSVAVAGCATNLASPPARATDAGSPQPTPVHGVTPGHKCQTAATDQFVGRTATGETGPAILRASHAAVLRWAPPGVMLTMDYREDRVTVFLAPDSKITKIRCG